MAAAEPEPISPAEADAIFSDPRILPIFITPGLENLAALFADPRNAVAIAEGWLRRAQVLQQRCHEFRSTLIAEFARHGHVIQPHGHELQIGAFAEMLFSGNLDEAIFFHNRWARDAGYRQIGLVSRSPCVIDIGQALLQIIGDSFKVIVVW